MKYYIEDEDKTFEDINALIEFCIPDDYFSEDYTAFDDYLDENGEVDTGFGLFYPSSILYHCDQTTYYELFNDWQANYVESERQDAEWTLRRAEDMVSIGLYVVKIIDDEEDKEEENKLNLYDLI